MLCEIYPTGLKSARIVPVAGTVKVYCMTNPDANFAPPAQFKQVGWVNKSSLTQWPLYECRSALELLEFFRYCLEFYDCKPDAALQVWEDKDGHLVVEV